MKKQLVLLLTVVGTFIATSVSAQPYLSAHFGFHFPHPRVYCAPAPVVVYQQPGYNQPVCAQPGYDESVYAQPGYNQVYDNTVVYENRRPAYYHENFYPRPRYVEVDRFHDHFENRGHYQDRFHYDHRDGGYRRW